jgi:hypothetical protein
MYFELIQALPKNPFNRDCYFFPGVQVIGTLGCGAFGQVCLRSLVGGEDDGEMVAIKSIAKPVDITDLKLVTNELTGLSMVAKSDLPFLLCSLNVFQTLTTVQIVLPYCPFSLTDFL